VNSRARLAEVAQGRQPADLVLTNGRVFNVVTGELLDADLAVYGDTIAGVGTYHGLQTLDVRGRVLLPGFIDAYASLEASMLSLQEYARVVSAHGTTAAVFDFRGIAAVTGLRGLSALADESRGAPIHMCMALPLWAGDEWDTMPGRFSRIDPTMLSLPNLVGVAGWLTGNALLATAGNILDIGAAVGPLPALMSSPGADTGQVAALAALGVTADRRWLSPEEALDKLRHGLWLLAEESSVASYTTDLRWLSRTTRLERCCLVSGPRTADDLVEEGHLDEALRRAVRAGIDVGEAIRMVTQRPATLFGLSRAGALQPGYQADVVVVEDLRDFRANLVLKAGRPVARQGAPLSRPARLEIKYGRGSVQVAPLTPDSFVVHGHRGRCRVVALDQAGQTTLDEEDRPHAATELGADTGRDLCKIAVVERHSATGAVGVGLVRGFGLRAGALCCSFAGAGQNLIVVGVDDVSMRAAVERVTTGGGGIAVACGEEVRAALNLPVAGLLSPLSANEVVAAVKEVERAAWELGCLFRHPFLTLADLANTELGGFRLTERGLVDVDGRRLVPIQD